MKHDALRSKIVCLGVEQAFSTIHEFSILGKDLQKTKGKPKSLMTCHFW